MPVPLLFQCLLLVFFSHLLSSLPVLLMFSMFSIFFSQPLHHFHFLHADTRSPCLSAASLPVPALLFFHFLSCSFCICVLSFLSKVIAPSYLSLFLLFPVSSPFTSVLSTSFFSSYATLSFFLLTHLSLLFLTFSFFLSTHLSSLFLTYPFSSQHIFPHCSLPSCSSFAFSVFIFLLSSCAAVSFPPYLVFRSVPFSPVRLLYFVTFLFFFLHHLINSHYLSLYTCCGVSLPINISSSRLSHIPLLPFPRLSVMYRQLFTFVSFSLVQLSPFSSLPIIPSCCSFVCFYSCIAFPLLFIYLLKPIHYS